MIVDYNCLNRDNIKNKFNENKNAKIFSIESKDNFEELSLNELKELQKDIDEILSNFNNLIK